MFRGSTTEVKSMSNGIESIIEEACDADNLTESILAHDFEKKDFTNLNAPSNSNQISLTESQRLAHTLVQVSDSEISESMMEINNQLTDVQEPHINTSDQNLPDLNVSSTILGKFSV